MRAPSEWTAFTISGVLYLLSLLFLRLAGHGAYEWPALAETKDLLPYAAVALVMVSYILGQLVDGAARMCLHRPVDLLSKRMRIELRFTPEEIGPNRELVRALRQVGTSPAADMIKEHLRDMTLYRTLAPSSLAFGISAAIWLHATRSILSPWPTLVSCAGVSILCVVVYYDRVKHLRLITLYLTRDPQLRSAASKGHDVAVGSKPVPGTT